MEALGRRGGEKVGDVFAEEYLRVGTHDALVAATYVALGAQANVIGRNSVQVPSDS